VQIKSNKPTGRHEAADVGGGRRESDHGGHCWSVLHPKQLPTVND
jgi:hypothetical protein